MKYLIIILLFSSCATRYCQPSKGSKDYAFTIDKIDSTGPGWEVYAHRFLIGNVRESKMFFSKCRPEFEKGDKIVLPAAE